MRVLKFIVNAFVLVVFLPVTIVAVLGIAFSPLQTSARAVEPRAAFEASDIMWDAAPESGLAFGGEPPSSPEPALEPEIAEALESDSEPLTEQGFLSGEEAECESSLIPAAELELEAEAAELLPAMFDLDLGYAEETLASEEGYESDSQDYYTSDQLRVQGAIYDDGYRYTWYSQRVLPGGGLSIEGRHVSDEGYVVDAQERIVVASSDLPYGAEIDVPFGDGRAVVLDTGCASGTIDVYTDF